MENGTHTNLVVETRRGKAGRWRWFLRSEGGGLIAMSPVNGYDSEDEAESAAFDVMSSSRLKRYIIGIVSAVAGAIVTLIVVAAAGGLG